MKDTFNTSSLSLNELSLVNGGEFRIIIPYDAPLTILLKSIFEFGKSAAEYQASLPPNLKNSSKKRR